MSIYQKIHVYNVGPKGDGFAMTDPGKEEVYISPNAMKAVGIKKDEVIEAVLVRNKVRLEKKTPWFARHCRKASPNLKGSRK